MPRVRNGVRTSDRGLSFSPGTRHIAELAEQQDVPVLFPSVAVRAEVFAG